MKKLHYVNKLGQVQGPITLNELTSLFEDNLISAATQVCESGSKNWLCYFEYIQQFEVESTPSSIKSDKTYKVRKELDNSDDSSASSSKGGNKFNLMANSVNLIKLMVHKFLTKNIQREVPRKTIWVIFFNIIGALLLLCAVILSFEKSFSIFQKLIFLAGGVQSLLIAFLINVITDIRWFLQEIAFNKDLKD